MFVAFVVEGEPDTHLIAGTAVKSAELVLIDGGAFYREVDLPKPVEPATVTPPSS